MKRLNLFQQELTELTESDLIQFCQLNNIKSEELKDLNLNSNKLTNINFIQKNTPFINLKLLTLRYNKIEDITNLQYLVNLEILDISGLNLIYEQKMIQILKNMKNLKELYCNYTFNNYTKEQLKKVLINIKIY